MNVSVARASMEKKGFRNLRVVAKVKESAIITSFYLEPENAQDWRAFNPGQFLVFRVPVTNQGGTQNDYVLRNYSVSNSPNTKGQYRITVKREAAPIAGLPDGVRCV